MTPESTRASPAALGSRSVPERSKSADTTPLKTGVRRRRKRSPPTRTASSHSASGFVSTEKYGGRARAADALPPDDAMSGRMSAKNRLSRNRTAPASRVRRSASVLIVRSRSPRRSRPGRRTSGKRSAFTARSRTGRRPGSRRAPPVISTACPPAIALSRAMRTSSPLRASSKSTSCNTPNPPSGRDAAPRSMMAPSSRAPGLKRRSAASVPAGANRVGR